MIRWRREKRAHGLAAAARIVPYGYDLYDGDKKVAHVQAHTIGWGKPDGRWYWYGFNRNTVNDSPPLTFETSDAAKKHCRAAYDAQRKPSKEKP